MKSAKNNNNKKKKNGNQSSRQGDRYGFIAKAMTSSFTNTAPRFSASSNSVTISHREMIRVVNNSEEFTILGGAGIPVNPGLTDVFPWLSRVAGNFEQYRFKRLDFIFEPSTSTASTGNIYLGIDYDASDPKPIQESDIASFVDSTCTQVFGRSRLCCAPQRMRGLSGLLYTRVGSLEPNQDNKTYDVGQLFVGTAGGSDFLRIGTLWVEYVIELVSPGKPMDLPVEASFKITGSANPGLAVPLGDAAVLQEGVYNPVRSVTSSNIYFDKVGQYLITATLNGTGLNGAGSFFDQAGSTCNVTPVGNTCSDDNTWSFYNALIDCTQPGQTALLSAAGIATTLIRTLIRAGPYKRSFA